MRWLVALLIAVNLILGLSVVHQNNLSQKWLDRIAAERAHTLQLQREYAQLHGEYSTTRGDLEDGLIARNRLGMVSPKGERGVITVGP